MLKVNVEMSFDWSIKVGRAFSITKPLSESRLFLCWRSESLILRRFYACPMALYGAFTPVLHTISASITPMESI
jgi:hypothetical protein